MILKLSNPAGVNLNKDTNRQIFLSIIDETSHRKIEPELGSTVSARLDTRRQGSLSLLSKPPPRRAFSQCAQMFSASRPTKPNDHLMFSIFNAIFCNWCCLGLLALRISVKSMRAYDSMQYEEATRYSRLGHRVNQALLVSGIFLSTCYVVWIIYISFAYYPNYEDDV